MLLIVASPRDAEASALAAGWAEHQAQVLTSVDLSAGGLRYSPGSAEGSTLRPLEGGKITGVLTRLPWVTPADLENVQAEDRAYVSAEMNAFLVAWLSDLNCRVVNRPTPSCLVGPGWPPEVWVHLAATLDVPVRPVRRRVPSLEVRPPGLLAEGCTMVVVIGDHAFGDVDSSLHRHACSVARAAGTDLLGVAFDGPDRGARFVVADPLPPLAAPELIEAVGAFLSGDTAC